MSDEYMHVVAICLKQDLTFCQRASRHKVGAKPEKVWEKIQSEAFQEKLSLVCIVPDERHEHPKVQFGPTKFGDPKAHMR